MLRKWIWAPVLLVLFSGLLWSAIPVTPVATCRTVFDQKSTPEQVQKRYCCIPKGVTLEGIAEGIPVIQQIMYEPGINSFTLNRSIQYSSPLERKEMIHILRAVLRDERIGVSYDITTERATIFGEIRSDGSLAKKLIKADTFLAGVTFGWDRYLQGTELPRQYQPAKVPAGSKTVGYYVFDNYRFAVNEGKLQCLSMTLRPQVFPVTKLSANNGGFQLDEEALERKDFLLAEHQANLRELYANMDAYLALPVVAETVRIGEAAAFARFLIASNVELKTLLKQM